MEKNELGILGENMATEMLTDKGYEILARNWRVGKNELDIVARLGDLMVFVEVKTLKNAYVQEPWEQVGRGKQKTIIALADEYLQVNDISLESRFDVVSIVYNKDYKKIEHFEDAFYPMM